MKRTSRIRTRRKKEARDRILDAARAVFAIEGAEGLTLRGLAARTGLVPSAAYKHFPNKQAILDELRRDALSRLALALTDAVEAVRSRFGGPLAALREAALAYLRFASEQRQFYELAFERGSETAALVTEAFADLLARARRADAIEDADRHHAMLLWHLLHGRSAAAGAWEIDDAAFVDACLAALPLAIGGDTPVE